MSSSPKFKFVKLFPSMEIVNLDADKPPIKVNIDVIPNCPEQPIVHEKFSIEDGYTMKFISLDEISFKPSDQKKLDKNLEEIISSGKVWPINVNYIENGKYSLNDGNHRCFVCYKLGYKKIPVMLYDESSFSQ